MAKYEVISKGIFVQDAKGKLLELEVGDVIDESNPHIASKLREVNQKTLEVATPEKEAPKDKKTK